MLIIQKGNTKECNAVRYYALMNSKPITAISSFSSLSETERFKLISSSELVCGSIQFIKDAVESIGGNLPEPDYYPDVLFNDLHRSVWSCTSKDAREMVRHDPLFIKSKEWKKLTGRVFTEKDLVELGEMHPDEMVYCAIPVNFIAEWRVYVNNGRIVGIGRYDDNKDEGIFLDLNVVNEAIQKLNKRDLEMVGSCFRGVEHLSNPGGLPKSSITRSAYCFDWGLLDTGETALVENGDAWAVGLYENVDPILYTEMLINRWGQIRDLALYHYYRKERKNAS